MTHNWDINFTYYSIVYDYYLLGCIISPTVTALCTQSSGEYSPSEVLKRLHESLATPPDITTLRVNTHRHKAEDALETTSIIIESVTYKSLIFEIFQRDCYVCLSM